MISYSAQLTRPAVVVFDPIDVYARELGFLGEKPRPVGPLTFDLTARQVEGRGERGGFAGSPFNPATPISTSFWS